MNLVRGEEYFLKYSETERETALSTSCADRTAIHMKKTAEAVSNLLKLIYFADANLFISSRITFASALNESQRALKYFFADIPG